MKARRGKDERRKSIKEKTGDRKGKRTGEKGRGEKEEGWKDMCTG